MMTCNVFSTVYVFKKLRTSIMFSFIISIVVNIGMWFERFVIIVTSAQTSHLLGQCSHQPKTLEFLLNYRLLLCLVFAIRAYFPSDCTESNDLKSSGDKYKNNKRDDSKNSNDDDDVLLHAVKDVKAANHHIEEVFTPFPVHGLDKAMGLAPTHCDVSFMFGCLGLSIAICLQTIS